MEIAHPDVKDPSDMPCVEIDPARDSEAFTRLSARDQSIVAAFLVTMSHKEAAKAVGIDGEFAHRIVARILRRPQCQLALSELLSTKFHVTRGRVWHEIVALATSDVSTYFEQCPFDGTLSIKPLDELSRAQTAAIRKVKQTTRSVDGAVQENVIEFELYDKTKPLAMLSRIHNLSETSPHVTVDAGSQGVNITIDASDAEY